MKNVGEEWLTKVKAWYGDGYARGSRIYAEMVTEDDLWAFLSLRKGKKALEEALGRQLTQEEWCKKSGKGWINDTMVCELPARSEVYEWKEQGLKDAGLGEQIQQLKDATK